MYTLNPNRETDINRPAQKLYSESHVVNNMKLDNVCNPIISIHPHHYSHNNYRNTDVSSKTHGTTLLSHIKNT